MPALPTPPSASWELLKPICFKAPGTAGCPYSWPPPPQNHSCSSSLDILCREKGRSPGLASASPGREDLVVEPQFKYALGQKRHTGQEGVAAVTERLCRAQASVRPSGKACLLRALLQAGHAPSYRHTTVVMCAHAAGCPAHVYHTEPASMPSTQSLCSRELPTTAEGNV